MSDPSAHRYAPFRGAQPRRRTLRRVTSFAGCAGSQIAASTILALARFTSLNLLLTISGQHQTLPSGHASRARTVTAFVRWRLFDLSAWWSKRHVGRQRAP